MKQRVFVEAVASIVVLVFAIGIWSTGAQVDLGWLRYYSCAVTAAVVVLWLWDRLLWKLPLAQRIPGVPRNLNGTWQGTLTSLWEDSHAGAAPAPKPAYLVVRQTASAVSAILFSDESRSVSSLAIVSSGDGTATLDYLYVGRPDIKVEDRSRMHNGSASLDVTGSTPTRLKGRYWTDRNSRGELDFTSRSSQRAEDFDEAVRLFTASAGED